MSDERTIQMLRRVLDGFNEHDVDAIMAHFAEDIVVPFRPRGAWLAARRRSQARGAPAGRHGANGPLSRAGRPSVGAPPTLAPGSTCATVP